LKSAESATKAYIEAAVNGTVGGISKSSKKAINDIDMELLKTKYRLEEQKDRLSSQLKDALNGAKEAASAFSAETKAKIEEAVTDAKLKSVEILGLMKETIKHSVKTVIDAFLKQRSWLRLKQHKKPEKRLKKQPGGL